MIDQEVRIEILVCDGEGMLLKCIVDMQDFVHKSILKKGKRGSVDESMFSRLLGYNGEVCKCTV